MSVDQLGFVEAGNSVREPEPIVCPYCQNPFNTLSGAKIHLRAKHPGEPIPPEWPTRRGTVTTAPSRPHIEEPSAELREVHAELVESVESLGGLIAGLLGGYKEGTVKFQAVTGRPLRLPLVGIEAPYLETTFGHTVALRAPLTAKIVMDYAEHNPALLGWVKAFNSAMKGGEVTGLVIDHALALAHTVRPESPRINLMAANRLSDAMAKVMQENMQLQAEVDELRAKVAAAKGGADDERGTGN